MKRFFVLLIILFSLFIVVGCSGKKTAEYKEKLEDVTEKMYKNSSEVAELLDQYSEVWSYSIESRGAIPVEVMSLVTGLDIDSVEEHFSINSAGNISDDFSSNIHSLNSYYESIGVLGEIKDTSDEIKEIVSELKNPPSEFEKVYDEVLDMYNLTEEYVDMALDPNGSLQSFNEDKKKISSEIDSKYKRIEVVMPE